MGSEDQLASLPFWPPGSLSVREKSEGSPDLENKKCLVSYLQSGQGPASSLSCPAIVILEFQSTGYIQITSHFTLGELTHTENLLYGRHHSKNIWVHFIGEETKCVNNFREITQLVRMQIPGVWPQILNGLSAQIQNPNSWRTRSACTAFCRPTQYVHVEGCFRTADIVQN